METDENTFRRPSVSHTGLGFPVAMRSDSRDGRSWNSIRAEESTEENREYVMLHPPSSMEWSTMLISLLTLPNRQAWHVGISVTIIVNYLLAMVCFYFLPESLPNYMPVYAFCDFVYLFDVVLLVTYLVCKKKGKDLQVKQRSAYLLALDIVSLLPQEIIVWFALGPTHPLIYWCRFVSFVRMYRILLLFNDILGSVQKYRWGCFILQFVVIFLLLLHGAVCEWYSLGCRGDCVNLKTWTNHTKSIYLNTTGEWYLLCWYIAVNLMTNTGFGEYHADQFTEGIYCIIVMITGFALTTGFLIAMLTVQLVNSGYRRTKFETEVENIKRYLTLISATPHLKAQFKGYYDILWKNKNGIKDAAEFYTLPTALQMELAYDINVGHLQNSLLFKNQPEPLLRKVALLMEHIFLLPGDILYHQGVVKGSMVCVASGILEVLSHEDDHSPIISFRAGTILGEVTMCMTVAAKATVRAATYVELQVINRVEFMRIMLDHPDTAAQLRNEIDYRLDTALRHQIFVDKSHVIFNLLVSNAKEFRPIKLLKDKLSGNTRRDHQIAMVKLIAYTDSDPNTSRDDSTESATEFSEACLPLYKLAENITMIEKHRVCLTSRFPWILEPDSSLIRSWYWLVTFMQVTLCIMYPYFIVFQRTLPGAINTYGVICDTVYLIYVYGQCTTAICLKNKIIKKFRDILDWRMKSSSFYVAVFSLFPLEMLSYVMNVSDKNADRLYYLLKLNRMLRIWRLIHFLGEVESSVWRNRMAIRILKYAIYLMLIAFWSGALLFLESCLYELCTEGGWFYFKVAHAVELKDELACYEYPVSMSVYFGVMAIFCTGFGDIVPKTGLDIILVSVLMLCGGLITCYFTSQLCATFALEERARQDYQQIIFALGRFLEENRVTVTLYSRVMNFFCLQWNYDRGVDRERLLKAAPAHLRSAAQSTELQQALRESELFQMVDVDFLQMIASGAKIQILPCDEVICYAGDMGREMYIIQKGHCEVLSENNTIVNRYGPGVQIGVLEMLYGIPKRYTVRSVTNCKVISIDYRIYLQALSMFPTILEETRSVMEQSDLQAWVKRVDEERTVHVKPPKKPIKRNTMRQRLQRMGLAICWFMRTSFIKNLRSWSHKDVKEYWKPFTAMGKLKYLGFLLMPFSISPHGPFIFVWCFLRCIMIVVVCMVAPFFYAVTPYSITVQWMLTVGYVSAGLDMYVNMHMSFYNHQGVLISHPMHTAKHYLTHSFFLDFIALFPFKILIMWEDPTHSEGHDPMGHLISPHFDHCMWSMNFVLQYHRIPEAFNYLQKNILRTNSFLRLLRLVPLTLLIISISASLLFARTCKFKFSSTPKLDAASEIVYIDPQTEIKYYGYLKCLNGSWLGKSQFSNITEPLEVYLITFYWVTSSLTSVGMGDLSGNSADIMWITGFTIIFGLLLFGYAFATLGSGRVDVSIAMIRYQEMMTNLMKFLKKQNVDSDLQRKVFRYFEYVWKRTSGVRSQALCERLNTALIEDTVLLLYERTLREVPLFENVERSFIRVIAKHLREQYFLKGDTVVKSHDIQSNMYIIYRGKVEVLSAYNEMIACMGPGGLFGNIRQVAAGSSSVTITASRNLDVLVVSSETFYTVVKDYPRIKRNMDTLLQSVTDYIMPTTLIEDYVDFSEGSKSTVTNDIADNESDNKEIPVRRVSRHLSVSTIGTSSLGQEMNRESFITSLTHALNIFLPHKWCRFAIIPDNIIFKVTNVMLLVITYYDLIMITYMFVSRQYSVGLLVLDLILELIFYFKIFLTFHAAYMDRYGNYVIEFRRIAKHYFRDKWRVFWDFVPNLPIEFAAFAFPKNQIWYGVACLRLLHLLRIEYLSEKQLLTNRIVNQTMKLFVRSSLSLHLLTCMWYIITCPDAICPETDWPKYRYSNSFSHYWKSFYYITSLSTATGLGDIKPRELIQLIFTTCVMLLTRFLTAVIIGDIVAVINVSTINLVQYEYKISALQDVLQNQNLSGHQMKKLWGYVKKLWNEEKGQHMPELLEQSPYVLRCDIMSAMFGQHLRSSFLFNQIDEGLVRQLSCRLRRIVFFPGNYIVQHGDTDQNMYFIHSGEVSVLTVHPNLTETQHELLHSQDMFGLAQGLYHGLPHHFSFRAKTKVDILQLNLDSWYYMLKFFPSAKDRIYMRAQSLYVKV